MATDLLTNLLPERNWSPAEAQLAAAVVPVATGIILKDAPRTLWRNRGKVAKGMVAPTAQYLRATGTGETFEDSLGVDDSIGEILSGVRTLDAASQVQGRGSYALRRARDVAAAGKGAADIVGTVVKPTRKGVVSTVKKVASAPVRVGAATADTLKTLGKGIGTGLAADAAGTALAGAAVLAAAEGGLLNQFGGNTESSVKHAKDFMTTEVFGVTVPETDPVAAVAKSAGAFQDLSASNQELGRHGSSAYDHGRFVADEISEELGGGVVGTAVGGTAGVLVGGVTAGGQALTWLGEVL